MNYLGMANQILENDENYRKEFDKIASHKKIKGIKISGSKIIIFTKMILCTDPRDKVVHALGEFKISIDMNSSKIIITNLTQTINGYQSGMQAPHVFADGRPCLGTAQELINDCVARYEVASVVGVAINFLESVNIEDRAGAYINRWPVATKEMIEGTWKSPNDELEVVTPPPAEEEYEDEEYEEEPVR